MLVACAATKRDRPAPARDLYISPMFVKSRAYAERTGAAWYILSALHRLVHPDQVLAPYNVTLGRLSRAARWSWALWVAHALRHAHPPGKTHLVLLAGETYRSTLQVLLHELGYTTEAPLAGLGSGQILAWLVAQERHDSNKEL